MVFAQHVWGEARRELLDGFTQKFIQAHVALGTAGGVRMGNQKQARSPAAPCRKNPCFILMVEPWINKLLVEKQGCVPFMWGFIPFEGKTL